MNLARSVPDLLPLGIPRVSGVNLMGQGNPIYSDGIPRVSGGEPDSGAVEAGKKLYSPRERG